MRIAFFTSEVVPFANTGGLGDVCGALPLALEKLGVQVLVFMPYFREVKRFVAQLTQESDDVFSGSMGAGVKIYFIRNDALFDRDGLYGDPQGDFADNLERFQFFCLKGLESLKNLGTPVDIIHCHDWQTCLIPAYLKSVYKNDPFFKTVKSVLTIHNLAYQGVFAKKEFPKINLPENFFTPLGFEFYDQINFLKGGIVYSDLVTTVSKTYAEEIQTKALGCALEGVLSQRNPPVTGILNGLDYDRWNPRTDSHIIHHYFAADIENKFLNKQQLQRDFNFSEKLDVPVFGFVGRLSYQKGLDLLCAVMDRVMTRDLQMVFLGVGEQKYHKAFADVVKKYPQKLAAVLEFDEQTAHRIYAGSDIFLMPSRYEPCGLSQMISLRYATIPLTYKTGGLADTIFPYNSPDGRGNGFVFEDYSERGLLGAIDEALKVFQDRRLFSQLIQKALTHNFSWEKSALEYKKLYEGLAGEIKRI